VDVGSGAFFDPSLHAFVNPALLENLHHMNKLQGAVNARKWEARRAADPQLARPTSGNGKEQVTRPTPYTLLPTPFTLHPAPYTLHPTPCSLHPAPYTPHAIPHTMHTP